MKYTFTVNTDASHDPTTKTGAWACWIKSQHYLIKDGGVFPRPVANSSVAELMAIEQALLLLDKLIDNQEFLQSYRDNHTIVVYFNTDSKWSVHALQGLVKRSKHLALAKRIRSLTTGYETIPRHVKGHTKNDDSRSWVNNWCDKKCRTLLRKEVKKINGRSTKEKVPASNK